MSQIALTAPGASFPRRAARAARPVRVAQPRLAQQDVTQQAARKQAAPLQLTRRGRLVLIVLPLLLAAGLLAVLIAGAFAPAHATASAEGPGLTEVTVMQGESLWSLARTYAPEQDARDVVAQIQDLNHLDGPLRAGQTITIPTGH